MDMNINGRRRMVSSIRTIALLIMSIVFTGAIGVVMLVDTFAGTALADPSDGQSVSAAPSHCVPVVRPRLSTIEFVDIRC
jgi:hypothetical protein